MIPTAGWWRLGPWNGCAVLPSKAMAWRRTTSECCWLQVPGLEMSWGWRYGRIMLTYGQSCGYEWNRTDQHLDLVYVWRKEEFAPNLWWLKWEDVDEPVDFLWGTLLSDKCIWECSNLFECILSLLSGLVLLDFVANCRYIRHKPNRLECS